MMTRTLVVLATICFGIVMAGDSYQTFADEGHAVKQLSIYVLFWHVDQPTTVIPELYEKARSFSFEDRLNSYTNQVAVQDFLLRWNHGMLPRQEVFSVFYQQHLEEAKALFNVFYYAKDFETFYNSAVWARFNVNEGLFTYALSVAILHRPDTKYMKIPPLYEAMPHNFFNNEIIQQAYRIKMGDIAGNKNIITKPLEGDLNVFVINSNYSGSYLSDGNHEEDKLNYFTEDVGLNAFYFYFMHASPFWMSSKDYNLTKGIRGELYYNGHKELLARYYMERLSNGLSEIEHIDWHAPIVPGYHPNIFHPNGRPYPHRHSESHIPVYKYQYVQDVEDIENRISSAIADGFIISEKHTPLELYTPAAFNVLGNIVQGNADSVNYRYYDSLDRVSKKILGFNLEPVNKYQITPSVLEGFTTSMRDPAFYRLYKRIVGFLLKYKENLPQYTQEQLTFNGVKIESVGVDKLTTFFDNFESDIGNAVPVKSHDEAKDIFIKVRQQRLNHKPYTFHITVNSDKDVKAMVRVYLGPKYDAQGQELDISKNWMNFVQLDQWVVDLKTGANKIEQSDHSSRTFVPDEISVEPFVDKLLHTLDIGEQYSYTQQVSGFPNRLILPKSTHEGMPFKMLFYISPVETPLNFESRIWGPVVFDGQPMGYPLDRPLNSYITDIPNMYWKDVMIYHTNAEELKQSYKPPPPYIAKSFRCHLSLYV